MAHVPGNFSRHLNLSIDPFSLLSDSGEWGGCETGPFPPFKRRGMDPLQQLSSISKLLASGNHQKSDVYANYAIPSIFRTHF